MLEERALGAAQQRLIHDLALAEHVLQAVRRERAGQAPAHVNRRQQLFQRLEAFAGRVLQPRQLIEHDAVEAGQIVQLVEVVVVDDDDLRRAGQRRSALRWCTHRQRRGQPRPLRCLHRPHVGADALRRHHQPAFDVAVVQHRLHGGQRDGRLARADRRKDHRPVALVEEVCGALLIGS